MKMTPHITEKSLSLAKDGVYTIKTPLKTSVGQLKTILKDTFSVDVTTAHALVRKGKRVVFKGKKGKQKSYKLIRVSLEKGQSIPGFEIESDDKKNNKKVKKEKIKESN